MYTRGNPKVHVGFINRVFGKIYVDGDESSITIGANSVTFYMNDNPNYSITVPMSNVTYILRDYS